MITLEQLGQICLLARTGRLALFLEPLNEAMDEFHISDAPARAQAFIAQLAHESGSFRYVCELASGAAYEGRADLGNTEPGDGVRYKGRGLIQITGRANYAQCSAALFGDAAKLIDSPALLEQPIYACRSAAWFWVAHGLNELADAGDFQRITRRINGGLNGYVDRLAYFARAQQVLA